MKKLLICLTLLCCSLLVFSACATGRDNEQDNYGGDPMEFERFSLSTSGTTAESYVYEGYRTESGVHLAYYTSTSWWDNTVSDYVESRHVIRAIDGDDALYQTLCALLGDCRINEWAGFRGANPPDVLDGSSMGFQATLPDGSVITASGSNNFPPNYRRFSDALAELLLTEQITDTAFTDGTYELTLPESWVGVVRARFSEGMVTFSVDGSDGKDVTFFILDNTGYGYTSEDYPGRVAVGRLVSDDDIRFITARDLYAISAYAQKVSPEALALWESYERDKAAILESLRGVNGYTLYPEDGTVLYEAQAQELADSARSLWLYLHFAGEYAGGVQPTTINGRPYKPLFPAQDNIHTLEQVRNRFLQVFSADFTDKTLDAALADKDLLAYNGDIYAAYKKTSGEAAYNSWVDHVRDDGDGKFTVVMAVRMPPDAHTDYVELPAERNAAGDFVFTDYPYWDRSE